MSSRRSRAPTLMIRRRWRDYSTATGGRPVKDFLFSITTEERAEVVEAMKEVRDEGVSAVKHLRGDLYEVRAEGQTRSVRVLSPGRATAGWCCCR